MSTKSFLSQSIHTIFSKGTSLVLVFAAGIVTARWLGPEGRGIVALYQSIAVMIFPIAELGIRQSTAYLIGQHQSRDVDVYSNMQGIYFVVAVMALGILLFAYDSTGLLAKYGWLMALVFGAVVPLQLFESYHNGVFISKKQIERMNYLVMLDKFSSMIFLVALVIFFNMHVLGAALAYLFSRVTCFSLLVYWLKKEITISPKFDWNTWRELIKHGVLFSIALFVIQVNYRFSFLLLEHFKGTSSVGIYSVGVNLAEILKEIPLALSIVLFSRSANWNRGELKDSIKKTTMLSRLVFFLMLILCGIWAAVVRILIPMFYGINFIDSVALTWVLMPGIVLLGVFLVLNSFMAGQGKSYLSIFAFLPALLINLVLCVFFIPAYDYYGAAISATVSYAVGTLLFTVVFSKIYGTKIRDLFVLRKSDLEFLRAKFT